MADIVRLHDGSKWNEYYYNTTAGQWRIGSVPVNLSNVVLRPDSGIMFYRRGSTPIDITLLGVVPSTPARIVVNDGGVTFLGNVFPVDQTLSNASFNAIPGWVNNTGSVALADKAVLWDGSKFNYYHFNQAASQWRVGSVPVNQNNVAIPLGRPVVLERPLVSAAKSTLILNLPYSLQ